MIVICNSQHVHTAKPELEAPPQAPSTPGKVRKVRLPKLPVTARALSLTSFETRAALSSLTSRSHSLWPTLDSQTLEVRFYFILQINAFISLIIDGVYRAYYDEDIYDVYHYKLI